MSESRRKKRNSRSGAGILVALLLIIIAVAAAIFLLAKKEGLLDDLMTRGVTPSVQESIETEKVTETQATTEAVTKESIGMETLPVVETEPEPQYREEITLTFGGDILFDPGYAIMASMLGRGGDIQTSFDESLMEIMTGSDIFMLNNEFPYSDRGAPLEGKQYTFRAKPEYVSKLNDIGVDIVSLGNNHINDHGQDAMMDTFDTLDAAGIPYVGAGRDLEEASRPYYVEIEGVKIGFVCATQIERLGNPDTVEATENTPGVLRCLDPTRFVKMIKEAKENADFVVAYVHWGTESTENIDWLQQEQAPIYVEAGADLIIGDHPHVLQKMEIIDGVPVAYSMGNYLFNSSSLDTGLVRVTLDTGEKKIKSLEFIPAKQSGCVTRILEGSEKTRVIDYINSLSGREILDENGFIFTPFLS